MKQDKKWSVVLTTIQAPTPAVHTLHERMRQYNGQMIVAGDEKGPAAFDMADTVFLSLDKQMECGFSLSAELPTGHYARKNIGYLYAMREGAECIYETDDDNAPLPSWCPRALTVSSARCVDLAGWINVYRYFTNNAQIWPRGFPLQQIQPGSSALHPLSCSGSPRTAPIQQGLVNGSPDVDAIWRLTQDRPFEFDQEAPLFLGEGQWCPFNTQSTWWWPEAYPLMYVPSYCSFRMCDIWKSFIAQRCLWAMGRGVAFHAAEVFQDRNPHDYLKDFEDEVPGYLSNARIAAVLEEVELSSGPAAVGQNLHRCYQALIDVDVFPKKEMVLVEAWLADVGKC